MNFPLTYWKQQHSKNNPKAAVTTLALPGERDHLKKKKQ